MEEKNNKLYWKKQENVKEWKSMQSSGHFSPLRIIVKIRVPGRGRAKDGDRSCPKYKFYLQHLVSVQSGLYINN